MIDHDLYLPRTRDDADKVFALLDRVAKFDPDIDRLSLSMDLTTVHNTVGLRLDDMLTADNVNLAHDVYGIARHLDRETGELTDCFVPRFAQRS